MKDITNALEKLSNAFSKRPEILAGYLFGSYLKGTAVSTSDIDIAVLLDKDVFNPKSYQYMLELQNEVSKNIVDFKTEIIPTTYMSYPLRFTAPLLGKVIYCKDQAKRLREEKKLEIDYEELKELYDMRHKIIMERVKSRVMANS
ncbi:nucleotidyltransferase domain-containing protein [Candidatus Parcubacteria bacterium]|nr:nucleotidyltransferase domain-containing protein [Patescibacteria group bacterium]MBU4381241.1 nucleotidyltransferase domain-containing protein [Patescibacteria group bacterium]MCG2689273.1 nucleotidyltransferase domain-containing protein [Candidatus Parcubacteria bacterium]